MRDHTLISPSSRRKRSQITLSPSSVSRMGDLCEIVHRRMFSLTEGHTHSAPQVQTVISKIENMMLERQRLANSLDMSEEQLKDNLKIISDWCSTKNLDVGGLSDSKIDTELKMQNADNTTRK